MTKVTADPLFKNIAKIVLEDGTEIETKPHPTEVRGWGIERVNGIDGVFLVAVTVLIERKDWKKLSLEKKDETPEQTS